MGCTSSKPAVSHPSGARGSAPASYPDVESTRVESTNPGNEKTSSKQQDLQDSSNHGDPNKAEDTYAYSPSSSPSRVQSVRASFSGHSSTHRSSLSSRFIAGSETFDVDRLNTVASYSDAMLSAGSRISPQMRASSEIETIMEVYAIPETIRYFIRANERDRIARKGGSIVTNDLINDISTLYSKAVEPLINSLYPPVSTSPGSAHITSTLMRLATENKSNAKFLEMIEATYKNTNKTTTRGPAPTVSSSGTANLRLTLILKDGTSKALHFLTAAEYWLFLRSVKRYLRDEADTPVTLRCIWNRSGTDTASTSSDSHGLRSLMSGVSKSASPNANTVDLKCHIDGGVISFQISSVKTSIFGMSYGADSAKSTTSSAPGSVVTSPSASPIPDVKIEEVLAIAMSLDYVLQKTIVMEVDFLSYSWDEELLESHGAASAANSALCLDAHHETLEYQLPITFTNVGSRKMIFLSDSDFNVSDHNVRLNIYTNPRVDAISSERIKVGTFEVDLGSIFHEMQRVSDNESSHTKSVSRPRTSSTSLTCLPTLTPFHSRFPKQPLLENIVLGVPEHRRMLRLVIHSATNLLGFGQEGDPKNAPKTKLNVLCTVELKSATGEVLSGGAYAHKTPTIAGNYDPVWESDFYFPMQIDGKEIDSIVVKLRDANGYLRYRLLGQITIPSAVFVAVNELALLRLPIDLPDPSETSENFNVYETLGMLCVGTQTCPRIDSLIEKAYQSKPQSGAAPTASQAPESRPEDVRHPGDISRMLSSAGSATVSVCLRDVAPSETCWPYAEIASLAILSEQIHSSNHHSLSTSSVITVGQGHLFTGVDHLVIMPNTDFDNTLLRSSVEFDVASSVLEPILRIPWNHVYRIDSISEATLMITFTLHLSTTMNTSLASSAGASNVGKQSSKYPSNTLTTARPGGTFEASILIAPCPSAAIAAIIRERLSLYPIRSMVRSFWRSTSKMSDAHNDTTADIAGVSSPIELLSMAKSILSVIEKDHFYPFEEASRGSNADAVNLSLKVKIQILFGFLVEGCRLLRADLASHGHGWWDVVPTKVSGSASLSIIESRVRELIKLDLISSVEVLEGLKEKSSEKITRRLEYFMQQCEDHLHEVMLCSWDMIHPTNMVCAVDTLLRESQLLFRSTLEKMISSNELFSEALYGLGNKADFIKFILIRNKALDGSVKRTLALTGLALDDMPEARKQGNMYLLSPVAVDYIVALFSTAVLTETRLWLTRTLDSQIQAKRKFPSLPWDFDNIEGLITSPMPETFRYQINIYLSLCHEHFGDDQEYDKEGDQGRDRSRSEATHINALLALNGHIVKAVLKSLWIVADEYRRALQSKHWEEVANADDLVTNLQFLVSIANDCYRLNAVHVDAVLSIKAIDAHESEYYGAHSYATGDTMTMEDLAIQVTSEFDDVVHIAKKYIVRMLFADMTNIILDFDELWERSHPQVFKNQGKSTGVIAMTAHSLRNAQSSVMGLVSGGAKGKGAGQPDGPVSEGPPLETILATLSDYFKDLRVMLDGNLFMKLVVACADVCVVLYLTFLKDFAERHKTSFLPAELLSAIKEDLLSIRNCMALVDPMSSDKSEVKPPLELPSLSKKIKNIEDVVTLLSFDVGHVRVVSLMKELALAYGYDPEGVSAVESLVRTSAYLRGLVEVSSGSPNGPIISGQDTVEDLVAAWHNSVSIHRRAVPAGTTIAPSDVILRAFKADKSSPNADANKGQSAMRMIREKASNININPIDAHKKKKEATAVNFLRRLGLYELEKAVIKQSESSGSNSVATSHVPSGPRRSFTKSTKADPSHASLSHTESSESSIFDLNDTLFHKSDRNVTTSASFESYNFSDRVMDIVISKIRLKHIKSQSVIASANPYIVITMCFKNGPEPKSVKTAVKWNSPEASWSEELSFKSVGASSLTDAFLDVKVFDKEHIRRKRLLGSAEIRLGGLDMRPIGSWFALDGGATGSNGEIYLDVAMR